MITYRTDRNSFEKLLGTAIEFFVAYLFLWRAIHFKEMLLVSNPEIVSLSANTVPVCGRALRKQPEECR